MKKYENVWFCFPKSLFLQSFRVLGTKYERMNFLTYRERMYPMRCFIINQVLLWEKDFDRNYGMMPKEVVQLACVTTIKTAKFENVFGAEQNRLRYEIRIR